MGGDIIKNSRNNEGSRDNELERRQSPSFDFAAARLPHRKDRINEYKRFFDDQHRQYIDLISHVPEKKKSTYEDEFSQVFSEYQQLQKISQKGDFLLFKMHYGKSDRERSENGIKKIAHKFEAIVDNMRKDILKYESSREFSRKLEVDKSTYLQYIKSIDGDPKTTFEQHYERILNSSKDDPAATVHDLSILADTVQFYVLNKRCIASLNYLAWNPYANQYKMDQDHIQEMRLMHQTYCMNIDSAGKLYEQTRQPEHAKQHRSITESLAELTAECETMEKYYREQNYTTINLRYFT